MRPRRRPALSFRVRHFLAAEGWNRADRAQVAGGTSGGDEADSAGAILSDNESSDLSSITGSRHLCVIFRPPHGGDRRGQSKWCRRRASQAHCQPWLTPMWTARRARLLLCIPRTQAVNGRSSGWHGGATSETGCRCCCRVAARGIRNLIRQANAHPDEARGYLIKFLIETSCVHARSRTPHSRTSNGRRPLSSPPPRPLPAANSVPQMPLMFGPHGPCPSPRPRPLYPRPTDFLRTALRSPERCCTPPPSPP